MAVLPWACSGERYCGVPITWPVSVSADALGGAGDAEVGDLDLPVGGDQQVGRLDVAVHDAGGVRGAERVGGLGEEVADRRRGPAAGRAASSADSGCAVDQLHDQVGPVHAGAVGRRGLAEVVDGAMFGWCSDGGVPGLGLEAGPERRVVGVLGLEQLDRDRRGRARCRCRARPRPCRRWRSGSRAGSAGRRRRTCSGVGGSLVITASMTALAIGPAEPAAGDLAAGDVGAPGSSTATATCGSSAGANEMNQAYGGLVDWPLWAVPVLPATSTPGIAAGVRGAVVDGRRPSSRSARWRSSATPPGDSSSGSVLSSTSRSGERTSSTR